MLDVDLSAVSTGVPVNPMYVAFGNASCKYFAVPYFLYAIIFSLSNFIVASMP